MKKMIMVLTTLLVFSTAVMGNMFAQQKGVKKMRIHREDMMKKLNLTGEQENKISGLKTKHQKQMIDLRSELQKKRIDIRNLRNNPDLKRTDLISAVENINAVKNKMAVARANHQMDVMEILTPEQKKIWLDQELLGNYKDRKSGHRRFGNCEFQPYDNTDEEPAPVE